MKYLFINIILNILFIILNIIYRYLFINIHNNGYYILSMDHVSYYLFEKWS